MKAALVFMLATSTGLLNCQRKDSFFNLKDDIEVLYQLVHDQYKILSSIASEPLDVNVDGISSTYLLSKMSDTELKQKTTYLYASSVKGVLIKTLLRAFHQDYTKQYLSRSV